MGNPAGGLLLLLVGVMLLLMFVTGRLEWLFSLAHDVNSARTDGYRPGPPATAATGVAAAAAKPGSSLPTYRAP